MSKHRAIATGLAEASRRLRPTDRTELWQFDNVAERLAGPEIPLADAIPRLGSPRGGTEIGAALASVVAASPARDIILATDGLSHALDVQALARSGRRFTVVLVGGNALEANVGRLAALTGGQILLATGPEDAAAAIGLAIGSVRRPKPAPEAGSWPLARAAAEIGGAIVEAQWGSDQGSPVEPDFASAVGALAAAIALPQLGQSEATKVAADHGIVCHLTSLVLVDEAGSAQSGLPAQRKVPLMAASASFARSLHEAPPVFAAPPPLPAPRTGQSERRRIHSILEFFGRANEAPLRLLAQRIDWDADPEALRRGNLAGVPADVVEVIVAASSCPEVLRLVGPGDNALAVVVALIARSAEGSNRAAQRIARSVLKGKDGAAIAEAVSALKRLENSPGNGI